MNYYDNQIKFSVGEFVAVFNQTIEYAYPFVVVVGEVSNYKISKNKWVYFDLKDSEATVRCFGSIYQLSSSIEDGMMVEVKANPRLSNNFGFSLNFSLINPIGEGSIKRSIELLKQKLEHLGIFANERKRELPYPPQKIGLITSKESAAYADFIKVVNSRWRGMQIQFFDALVQGEDAPQQIINGLDYFNQSSSDVEVIVITRGGGSQNDLGAFNNENLVKKVASSRIPTMVAIGHEIDLSLCELACDKRASTPSNAAELLVPDRIHWLAQLSSLKRSIKQMTLNAVNYQVDKTNNMRKILQEGYINNLNYHQTKLDLARKMLDSLNPTYVLSRGYSILRDQNMVLISSPIILKKHQIINVETSDLIIKAKVDSVRRKEK